MFFGCIPSEGKRNSRHVKCHGVKCNISTHFFLKLFFNATLTNTNFTKDSDPCSLNLITTAINT